MKLIYSYSLYGDFQKYTPPLFSIDLKSVRNYLNRDVEFRVCADIYIPDHYIRKLKELGFKVELKDFKRDNIGGMFARYLPILENDSNVIIVRDTDSAITTSELDLVKCWLKSKFEFHVIRSHVQHIYPVMGGLFSVRGSAKAKFAKIFLQNKKLVGSSAYHADQCFLAAHIYPSLIKSTLVHSVRIVYSGENYLEIPHSSGFIGETVFIDEKRKRENILSKKNWKLLKLPRWTSAISFRRPFNRIVSALALCEFL